MAAKVDFVGFAGRAGESGGKAATTGFQFVVNGTIKVTGWASAFPGKLSTEEVKQRAKHQIEQRLDNGDAFRDGDEFNIKV